MNSPQELWLKSNMMIHAAQSWALQSVIYIYRCDIGILSNIILFYHLELQSPITDSSCITPTFMGQP